MNRLRSVFRRLFAFGLSTGPMALTPEMGKSVGAEAYPSPNPPFSIQQLGQASWLVKPNGVRFFSLGVCCVNPGASRAEWDAANPGYAAWQRYIDTNAWAVATVRRLKAWGFTTVGGWSDFQALRFCRDADLAFTPVLHIGATAGAPWWDMWEPKIVERMDQVAREQILPLRDDPRLLGYYTDNEIGWWNAILFEKTLGQAATSGQRQRLLQLLRRSSFLRDSIGRSWIEFQRIHFEVRSKLEIRALGGDPLHGLAA